MEEEIKKEEIELGVRDGLVPSQEILAREIWDKYKGEFSPKYIFLNYMKDFFNVPADGIFVKNKDWIHFVKWIKVWKLQDDSYVAKVTAANLSDDEVQKINETNAKELVVLLQNMIAQYQKKPETFKKLSFGDISKLYQIIKQIESVGERLELQKSKLKLDAAKTFLPYTRMSIPQLIHSRDLIVKSIDELIKNNESQLHSSPSREGGEQPNME